MAEHFVDSRKEYKNIALVLKKNWPEMSWQGVILPSREPGLVVGGQVSAVLDAPHAFL